MTLVLTCLTPEYVVQVSDKRVTLSDGAIVDDLRNKGTMYCAQMGFGYTGLAELEGRSTDKWLADHLARGRTLEEALQIVVTDLTNLFAAIRLDTYIKRQAFVGAGFCRITAESHLRACQLTISNFLSSDGKWRDRASPAFRVEGIVRSEDRPSTVCRPVGAAVPEPILKRLNRDVETCVTRGTSPLEVMRLLGETVRRVAGFTSTVGKALLMFYIPREAVERNPVLFVTPIASSGFKKMDAAMFLHVPEDANDPYWDLPNFVCQGMLAIGTFQQDSNDAQAPQPDAKLDIHSLRAFLLTSTQVQRGVELLKSQGVRVESFGLLDRSILMLRRVGITTPCQLDKMLSEALSWGTHAIAEYYSSNFPEAIAAGTLSVVRDGIVCELLVLSHPDVFSSQVLAAEYQWPFAETLILAGMKHNPRFSTKDT